MSESQPESSQTISPVLKTYLHDVRYFAALLRGVNFVNRATVTVTQQGLTVTVEEARTLLGTAFIFSSLFDEYEYVSENSRSASSQVPDSQSSEEQQDDTEVAENQCFEIPVNTLLECLNIFGSAGGSLSSERTNFKKWRKDGSDSEDENPGGNASSKGKQKTDPSAGMRKLETYFGGGTEKRTGMRMTWYGDGYPLTLLLQEETSGPTTTCEISTYEAESNLELDFDSQNLLMKIILKASWLRDALSELDPSCDKLTFIGNPPGVREMDPTSKRNRMLVKPVFRIHAEGTFGSTEMDYPNDREVLESVECDEPVSFTYRFSHISRAIRALQSSNKASIRIDQEGMLSMQFLMSSPKPGGVFAEDFIEFKCLAIQDD